MMHDARAVAKILVEAADASSAVAWRQSAQPGQPSEHGWARGVEWRGAEGWVWVEVEGFKGRLGLPCGALGLNESAGVHMQRAPCSAIRQTAVP